MEFLSDSRICSSDCTDGPGKNSGPTASPVALTSCLIRWKAATANSWSVEVPYQLGYIRGLIAVSVEFNVTFPRDVGATRTIEKVA